jgi:hypothetical protein
MEAASNAMDPEVFCSAIKTPLFENIFLVMLPGSLNLVSVQGRPNGPTEQAAQGPRNLLAKGNQIPLAGTVNSVHKSVYTVKFSLIYCDLLTFADSLKKCQEILDGKIEAKESLFEVCEDIFCSVTKKLDFIIVNDKKDLLIEFKFPNVFVKFRIFTFQLANSASYILVAKPVVHAAFHQLVERILLTGNEKEAREEMQDLSMKNRTGPLLVLCNALNAYGIVEEFYLENIILLNVDIVEFKFVLRNMFRKYE